MGLLAYLSERGGASRTGAGFVLGWHPTLRRSGRLSVGRSDRREPLPPATPPPPAWYADDWRSDPEAPRDPPRLKVELVPALCWGRDPFSYLTSEEWTLVGRAVARDAGERCEVCSAAGGPQHPLECHQLWEYDDVVHLQRFVRFVALCPSCHLVMHLGHAWTTGMAAEVTRHLVAVNGWTEGYVLRYIDRVFDIWRLRSEEDWTIDLSAMSQYGMASPGVVLSLQRPQVIRSSDRIHPDGTLCLVPEWGDDTTTPDGRPWWPLVGDLGVPRGGLHPAGGHSDPEAQIGCLPA